MQFSLVVLGLVAALAQAAPAPAPAPAAAPARVQRRDTSCSSHYYTDSQIQAAANAACQYLQDGDTAGSSTYPHQYNDYEGFSFDGVDGPYYEFPIKESGIYTGGSPGADRVIITGDCTIAGEITHSGASGNNFVACSGTD